MRSGDPRFFFTVRVPTDSPWASPVKEPFSPCASTAISVFFTVRVPGTFLDLGRRRCRREGRHFRYPSAIQALVTVRGRAKGSSKAFQSLVGMSDGTILKAGKSP